MDKAEKDQKPAPQLMQGDTATIVPIDHRRPDFQRVFTQRVEMNKAGHTNDVARGQ